MAGFIGPMPQLQVEAEILNGIHAIGHDEIREGVRAKAREIAGYARSIAPVYHGPPRADERPGEFRDSILAEDAEDKNGLPAARVISRSRIAHLLEYGTVKMEKRATFGQAAEAFGGTVDQAGPGETGEQGPVIT